MNNLFDPLVTVFFRHNYYADGKLKTLRILPAAETLILFSELALIFRSNNDGFTIYFDTLFNGRQRTKQQLYASGETLQFYVYNTDEYFLSYTDGLADYKPGLTHLHFTNEHGNQLLHPATAADEATITDNSELADEEAIGKKPFAVITLNLSPSATSPGHLSSVNLSSAITYEIQFAARATYWRYVLAASYLQQLEKPAIVNKQDKIPFKGPVTLTLPDNTSALSFISNDKMPFSENPNREFQLVEQYDALSGKYKVVKKVLPNPDISNLSVIDTSVDKTVLHAYSEIIL
jgi:hypothetical protein